MVIQKVINNNVVSTFDSNNHEVILMGKGIGFHKKVGDELDKTKIEKIFTQNQRSNSPFVQEVLAIIQEFYEIIFNTEDSAYKRFITHLEYLEELMGKSKDDDQDMGHDDQFEDFEFYERNQKKYPEAYICSQRIVEHIEQHYGYHLSVDEKMYLIIYVERLNTESIIKN